MRDETKRGGGLPEEDPGTGGPRADECPDANLLAAFAEDTLLPDEREQVEEHWLGCDRCRRIVADLVKGIRGHGSFRDAPVDWLRLRWRRTAAAAVAVAAVVFGVVLLRREEPVKTTEELLVAAASDLAGSRPELLGDFEPFTAAELEELRAEVRRGGVTPHEPAGTILSLRPEFEWSRAPGVAEYTVVLRRPDNSVIWRTATSETSLSWPEEAEPLDRGARYIWEVSGRGALGDAGAIRSFFTASAGEAESWKKANEALAGRVDASIRPLLRAHLALRRELRLEAARAAREFLAAHPDDPLGRATLDAVLRLLGEPD